MKLLFILAVMLCLQGAASATIGDDSSKVTERYGEPSESYKNKFGLKTDVHHFRGYVVHVTYLDQTSQREVFIKPGGAEIKPSEIEEILSRTSYDEEWKVFKSDDPDTKAWYTKKSQIFAMYVGPLTLNGREFAKGLDVVTLPYRKKVVAK